MRLPRVRITVRQMVALVAALGVSLGAIQAKQRHDLRQRCIAYHRVMDHYSTWRANNPTSPGGICGTGYEGVPSLASDPCRELGRKGANASRSLYLQDADFHARMRRYYEACSW